MATTTPKPNKGKKKELPTVHREGECPNCGGEKLEYAEIQIQGESAGYPYTCMGCGFEGEEWYNMVFDGHTDPDGNTLKEVDMIASGYEWNCPLCKHFNKEIETKEKVTCKKCKRTFDTNPAEHAHG